jgi:hypothetical protein
MQSMPFWRRVIAAAKPAGPPPIIITPAKFPLVVCLVICLIPIPNQICVINTPALERNCLPSKIERIGPENFGGMRRFNRAEASFVDNHQTRLHPGRNAPAPVTIRLSISPI